MKSLLEYLGINYTVEIRRPFQYKSSDYVQDGDIDKINLHRDFVKSLLNEENNRLNTLESKTAQLISQTGIIFSLLSLFIPIFIERISEQSFYIKITFVIVLVAAFVAYVLTINRAIRNYRVNDFPYSMPHPNDVIKYQKLTKEEFSANEVRDLLYSINQNIGVNNAKANNLIKSYKSFRTGNYLTALLGLFLCFSILIPQSKEIDVKISNGIRIENLDSNFKSLIEKIDSVKIDTIQIK